MSWIHTSLEICYYIFIACGAYQLFYFLFFYLRFAIFKNHPNASQLEMPPVSIIICARNEDTNLKQNLSAIIHQNYPVFEVIVVDDNSDDGTTEYLFFLSQKEPRIKRVKVGDVNRLMAGKKFALTLGLKAATYETILLTDADCKPASENWLMQMMQGYVNDKIEIVLGYGPYEKQKGFLNKLIRFETVHAALNYFSFALAKIPYMGVGRNLSYQKHLFFDHGGFTKHRTIMSGDDDLFINQVANKKNTKIRIDPQSFVYSQAKQTWEDWKDQKTRHLSTGKYYKWKHKFFLGLFSISHFLFYLLSIFLIAMIFNLYIVVGIFLFRWILLRTLYTSTMKKLDEKDLIPYVEIFDLLQVFYYLRFAKTVLFKMNYRWN